MNKIALLTAACICISVLDSVFYPIPASTDTVYDSHFAKTADVSEVSDISAVSIKAEKAAYKYTGREIAPNIAVYLNENELRAGIDYDISYSNNIDPGTALVTAELKGGYSGSFSDTFTIEPARPLVTDCDSSDNEVRLYWEMIPGVSGYCIYRLDGDSWQEIAAITNPDVTEYRDTGLAPGTTYTYMIKAFCQTDEGTLWSGESQAVSIATKLELVRVSEAYTCTTNAVRINWEKVNGASGYAVYTYDPADRSCSELTTVNGGDVTTCRISGLDSGARYTFTVRAINDTDGDICYSDHSDVIYTATKAEQVKITSTSKSANAVRLNWQTVDCDGYRIYRLIGGKWTRVMIIRDPSVNTYRTSGLDSGTAYTFKIRAYTTDGNGKPIYGKYSPDERVVTKVTDKLYYFKNSTAVYNTKLKKAGTVAAGSYYSGAADNTYPGYVMIDYMSEKYLVKKSAVTERKNAKVLRTGAVGQMGGSIYGRSACGPTAAAILVNGQKHEKWNKDDLILYTEKMRLNDQGSLRGGGGVTAPNMLKLINGYSNGKYTAKNIYASDPASILKKQIDSGNRAIVVVQYTSYIVTHYASGTHFVVICGYETIDGRLYFYYADPYYGGGPRSLLRVDAGTLAASMNMVSIEPRCIITLD